jgi:hypothetical protein
VSEDDRAPELAEVTAERDLLRGMIERIGTQHMRFGVIQADGTTEMLPCADWCYACKAERLASAEARLERIADAHSKDVEEHGMTSGCCVECGEVWPCPTYDWATTNRDPLVTWDPADDEGEK